MQTAHSPLLERIPRRRFLKIAGSGTAAALFAPAIIKSAQSETRDRILIVGAGIAGLAAAQTLRAAGRYPVIIEARNRIGGRIWTDSSGFDLGASWIHGKAGNPLTELAPQFKVQTCKFNYDNHLRYNKDGQLSDKADKQIDRTFEALADEIAHAQRTATASASLQDAVNKFQNRLAHVDHTPLRYAINTNITHEYASDPGQLSLKYFEYGDDQAGGDLFVTGGYHRLLSAEQNDNAIYFGHVAERIEWSEKWIVVHTNKDSFKAGAAIITLPLGVLKSRKVVFAPELPSPHLQAITRLGYGTLDKLVLHFPKVTWPKDPHLFGYVGEGLWEEWVNMAALTGQAVLVGLNAGKLAERLSAQNDAGLVASAMRVLRRAFGATLPDPIRATATRWHKNPFSLGSYSNYAPGSAPEDRTALAAPISKNLIFAGEACSRGHPGTVHGALLSGRESAKFILDHTP